MAVKTFGAALVSLAIALLVTPAPALAIKCEETYAPIRYDVRNAEIVQLTRIPNPPPARPLTPREEQLVFEDGKIALEYGKNAIDYLKTRTDLSPEGLADLWIALVSGIQKRVFFLSDMYRVEGGRFLFRGASGETLVIDNDGSVFRIQVPNLPLGDSTWVMDFTKLRRITP